MINSFLYSVLVKSPGERLRFQLHCTDYINLNWYTHDQEIQASFYLGAKYTAKSTALHATRGSFCKRKGIDQSGPKFRALIGQMDEINSPSWRETM